MNDAEREDVRRAACVVRAMMACCRVPRRLPALPVLRLAAWNLREELPDAIRARDEDRLRRAELTPGYAGALLDAFPDDGAVDALQAGLALLLDGLPPPLVGPAVDKWASLAPDRVRRDPYGAVWELGGALGDADAVAGRLAGRLPDGTRDVAGRPGVDRVAGHARWHLLAARKEGHTAVPSASVARRTAAALGMSVDDVVDGLARAKARGALAVLDPAGDADEHLADPETLAAERQLADHVRRRAARPGELRPPADALAGLTDEQRAAVGALTSAALSVLTGPPGSGKTTVVRALVAALGEDRCLLTAPTGRAARNLGGSTVHSASGGRLLRRPLQETSRADVPDDLLLMVVDEASMLSTELAVGALSLAPEGCHVVLVGDPDQLGPIGHGDVLRDLIATRACPVAALAANHRCADGVRAMAAAVARGDADGVEMEEADERAAVARVVRLAVQDRAQVLVATNAARAYYNRAVQSATRPGGVPVRIRGEGWGVPDGSRATWTTDAATGACAIEICETGRVRRRTIETDLSSALSIGAPPSGAETLCVDDLVMVTKNQNKKRLARGQVSACNGDVGRLVRAGGLAGRFVVGFDDGVAEFATADTLTLGYAATVHKFQGSECDVVVLPVDHRWDRHLLYTAVTRARTRAVLVGRRSALRAVLERTRPDRATALRMLLSPPA